MPKYSMTEVIEMAVQTEKLGYAFYTRMAGKFKKQEKMAEFFSNMAEKEVWHEKVFTGLLGEIDESVAPENWEEAQSYFRAVVQSEFFLGTGMSLPAMIDSIKTVSDAVDFAIGFEKETVLYFIGIKDMVGDNPTLDKIIEEEKSHVSWLGKFKESL